MTNDTTPRAALMEAVADVLERAPCDCSHKRRYEDGDHLSGCYLFDLNLADREVRAACEGAGSEHRQTLIDSLRASKGWMTGYAEAFVDDALFGAGSIPLEFPDNLALNTSLPGDALIALFRDNSIPMSDANQRLFDVIDRSFSEAGSTSSEVTDDHRYDILMEMRNTHGFVGEDDEQVVNLVIDATLEMLKARAALAVPSEAELRALADAIVGNLYDRGLIDLNLEKELVEEIMNEMVGTVRAALAVPSKGSQVSNQFIKKLNELSPSEGIASVAASDEEKP